MYASADQLNATFAALADPTRRAILARLASGEASVQELSKPFEISQTAITKHLKVLEKAGLIPRGLETKSLRDAEQWIERYRRVWEDRLDRLETYIMELQEKEQNAPKTKKPRRK